MDYEEALAILFPKSTREESNCPEKCFSAVVSSLFVLKLLFGDGNKSFGFIHECFNMCFKAKSKKKRPKNEKHSSSISVIAGFELRSHIHDFPADKLRSFPRDIWSNNYIPNPDKIRF